MSLIGRKVEISRLKKLYDLNYVIKVQGPPSSGKSTLIHYFLDKIVHTVINFHDINWQSITDTYLYFKDVFSVNIDDPDKDIVDLAYLFNNIVEHIDKTVWLRNCESLWFDTEFTKPVNTPKYLFWTFFNTLHNSKKCKIIISVSNSVACIKSSIDRACVLLELSYFTYDDSQLYWNYLTGDTLSQNIYDISGGDPTVLKLCAYNPITTIENIYLLELLKIKELFGEPIYNTFIDDKGIVLQNKLEKFAGFTNVLNCNYIHVYQLVDKKNMISLKPIICHVIRRSIRH